MKLEIVLNEEKAKEHHYNIHKGYAKIEDFMIKRGFSKISEGVLEWDDNFDLENEQRMEEQDCIQCKYCGVPKIEKPCQDCNNNHFYQFLGLEGDEDCFEEAKDINSKIIDS